LDSYRRSSPLTRKPCRLEESRAMHCSNPAGRVPSKDEPLAIQGCRSRPDPRNAHGYPGFSYGRRRPQPGCACVRPAGRPAYLERSWHVVCWRAWVTGDPASMIQLTFHDAAGAPGPALESSDFRITGGVLWSQVEHGLIACFAGGCWKHRGEYYPSISMAGACCLAFGIARDALVSEPISLFSVTGTTLRANGVAVAEYDERQVLWQGLIRPISWQA